MPTTALSDAAQFFYDHAGYSYHPAHETAEEGRVRCANELAYAEACYRQSDAYVMWEEDPEGWQDDRGTHYPAWQATLVGPPSPHSNLSPILAALGGIDTDAPDYMRVIEAELADEALDRL